jgi:hypothetical protein
MRQILTAERTLYTTRDQFRAVRQTQVAYRAAQNALSRYAFADWHGYLAHNALLAGDMALKVDAYKTSQACPRYGYTSEDDRSGKGLLFVCQTCHFKLQADLVGARKVAPRTLLARQDWGSMGVLSERPDVSDDEAKAARRRR